MILVCLNKIVCIFQLTGLSKILQAEIASSLRSRIVLPLQLGCERDEALARLTEGRVPACTHDLVPDLLRTKPEPQAEQRLQQFNHKASTLSYDTAQVFYFIKLFYIISRSLAYFFYAYNIT